MQPEPSDCPYAKRESENAFKNTQIFEEIFGDSFSLSYQEQNPKEEGCKIDFEEANLV